MKPGRRWCIQPRIAKRWRISCGVGPNPRRNLGEPSRSVKLNCQVDGQRNSRHLIGLPPQGQRRYRIRDANSRVLARQNRYFELNVL